MISFLVVSISGSLRKRIRCDKFFLFFITVGYVLEQVVTLITFVADFLQNVKALGASKEHRDVSGMS